MTNPTGLDGIHPSTGPGTGLPPGVGSGPMGGSQSAMPSAPGLSAAAQVEGAQVQVSPAAAAIEQNTVGSALDWGRWGAIAVGTGFAAKNLPQYTIPIKEKLADQYRDMRWNGGKVVDAAADAVKVGPEAAAKAATETAESTGTKAAESAARAGSVLKQFGKNVGGRVLTKVPLGRTVAKVVGSTVAKGAAQVGMRLGLRLAAFAIPGPGWAIGAAVLAATWIFDSDGRTMVNNLIGKLFGVTNSPAIDAAPEPPDTYFLPLTHDGDRDGVIRSKDAELVQVNNDAFKFDPNKAWHPTAPAIETTSTFQATTDQITALMTEAAELNERLERIYKRYSSEQYVARAYQASKPMLTSFEQFHAEVLPALGNAVSAAAEETNNLYQAVREANSAARQEISNSGAGILPWTSKVDESKMGDMSGALATFTQNTAAIHQGMNQAITGWTVPTFPTGPTAAAGTTALAPLSPKSAERPSTTSSPSPSLSVPLSPSTSSSPSTTSGGAGTSSKKPDIAEALRNISSPAASTPNLAAGIGVNPAAGQTNSPLGQLMNGLNNGLNGLSNNLMGANQAGLAGLNPNLYPGAAQAREPVTKESLEKKIKSALDERDNKNTKAADAVETPDKAKKSDEEKEEKNDTGPAIPTPLASGGAPGGTAGPAAPTAPAAETKPAAADSSKPFPRPPTAPDAAGQQAPAESTKTVEVGGKSITFEDPRLAKMVGALAPHRRLRPGHRAASRHGGRLQAAAGR
ncbi:hypothetical protein EEB14_33345 [Rhodococcus sp. WS4]|nr:hypothetical protein EEB14_33345 [Rhodococcus sp. WS4]